MSLFASIKKIARLLLPPIMYEGISLVLNWRIKPLFEYAPNGWKTIGTNEQIRDWNVESIIETEKVKWDDFCHNLEGTGPLGFSHESPNLSLVTNLSHHNIHMTFAYILALSAQKKKALSVLDWGGALGHYFLLGKTVLPGITIDFHCKELPLMAETGKLLNPKIHWYTDESCLEKFYDLVMISGSLQYIENWEKALRQICGVAKEYFFLSRIPIVENGPSFVMIERYYSPMLNQVLNQDIFLKAVENTGLRLIREFVVFSLKVKNAPEDVIWKSWLFKREPN